MWYPPSGGQTCDHGGGGGSAAGGVVLTTAAGARRTDTAYPRFLRSSRGADVEVALSGPGGRQNLGGVSSFYAAVARLPAVDLVAPTVGVSAVAPGRGNAGVLLATGGRTDHRRRPTPRIVRNLRGP